MRLCNQTDASVAYRMRDENHRWSEQRELEPRDCNIHELHGSQPHVPVRFILSDGASHDLEAMAGVVVGRPPEPEVDWKPWENQLVTAPDGGLQLKWDYQERRSLRSVLQQP